LVLLVIFMVTAPMITSGIKVDLPKLLRFWRCWHLTITPPKAKKFMQIVHYLLKRWLPYFNVSLWVQHRKLNNADSPF